jgi:hypothetical protein
MRHIGAVCLRGRVAARHAASGRCPCPGPVTERGFIMMANGIQLAFAADLPAPSSRVSASSPGLRVDLALTGGGSKWVGR